jgi:glutamate racemase
VASPGPIGVFDSGVGGLSVLHEIHAALPTADLLYVADSGHCPYGDKSDAEIRDRALTIARYLAARHVRGIVVACNTATAAAIGLLRATFPDLPIVGMEPALKPAAAATRSGVVGVLATGATLGGERFAGLAKRWLANEGIELLTQACPGLVERVETGDLEGPATRALLRRYVAPLLAGGADTIVLGCTHYPFLRPALRTEVGPGIALIDTGAAVARQTARVIGPGRAGTGHVELVSSDLPQAAILTRLWGASVPVEALPV